MSCGATLKKYNNYKLKMLNKEIKTVYFEKYILKLD